MYVYSFMWKITMSNSGKKQFCYVLIFFLIYIIMWQILILFFILNQNIYFQEKNSRVKIISEGFSQKKEEKFKKTQYYKTFPDHQKCQLLICTFYLLPSWTCKDFILKNRSFAKYNKCIYMQAKILFRMSRYSWLNLKEQNYQLWRRYVWDEICWQIYYFVIRT